MGWEKQKILRASSVGIINIGYKTHISEIYEHLNELERNCIHNIYERLEKSEQEFSLYYEECRVAWHTNRDFDDIIYRYKKHFKDLLESYDIIVKLIDSYLNKNPIDVFYVNK